MMPTIFQALAAVMADVQGVAKNDRNTAPGGNYTFRGIDAVTNAVGPALRKHGVIVAPEVIDYQYGTLTVGQAGKERQMGHARLTIAFTWYGPEGDSIRSVAAGEAFDAGDKATPKAHSVAFRTAMIQTLCLPTDEPDPDTHTYERAATPAVPADPLTAAKRRVAELAKTQGHDVEWLRSDFAEWSQGHLLADASATDLVEYAKTLEPTTKVSRDGGAR